MSDETAATPHPHETEVAPKVGARTPRRAAPRAGRGGLGTAEAVALSCAALLLLAAAASYLFLLRPERARLRALDDERTLLTARMEAARGEFSARRDTQSSVREILSSLEYFELNGLGAGGDGGTRVYEELHTLMLRNNLRLSGGASYTQLQEAAPASAGSQQQQRADAARGRVAQSVFPGVGVTLTVEGTYPNLRRFIRDVEGSGQFVVINTVELEGASGASSGGGSPDGEARANLVSLRLDMASYFRRAGAQ